MAQAQNKPVQYTPTSPATDGVIERSNPTPVQTTVPAVSKTRPMAVRFSPPTYEGKADANGKITRPYRAAAVIVGMFGTLPIQLAGFQLQSGNGGEMIVHFPFTSKTFSGVPAIQPESRHLDDARRQMLADSGLDVGDRTVMPVAGSAAAVEALQQAIRDAWAEANKGGTMRWNAEIPLRLTL